MSRRLQQAALREMSHQFMRHACIRRYQNDNFGTRYERMNLKLPHIAVHSQNYQTFSNAPMGPQDLLEPRQWVRSSLRRRRWRLMREGQARYLASSA